MFSRMLGATNQEVAPFKSENTKEKEVTSETKAKNGNRQPFNPLRVFMAWYTRKNVKPEITAAWVGQLVAGFFVLVAALVVGFFSLKAAHIQSSKKSVEKPSSQYTQNLVANNSPGAIITQINGNNVNPSSVDLFKQQAFKLLAKDAIDIYNLYTTWSRMLENPQFTRRGIPLAPEIPLTHWNDLKRNGDFIYLEGDKSFDKIVSMFRDFEKLNEEIKRAKTGDMGALSGAIGFPRVIILVDRDHVKLLKLFKEDEDVTKFIDKWDIK